MLLDKTQSGIITRFIIKLFYVKSAWQASKVKRHAKKLDLPFFE